MRPLVQTLHVDVLEGAHDIPVHHYQDGLVFDSLVSIHNLDSCLCAWFDTEDDYLAFTVLYSLCSIPFIRF